MVYITAVCFFLHSEDGEEATHQDTDSDVAEPRDGGKVKVKWTQEEVIVMTSPSNLHDPPKEITPPLPMET